MVSDVIQRQNDTAEILFTQQILALLHVSEIPVFDGDPLHFRRAFEHGIKDKSSNSQGRLYFLEQYTSGQSKDLVRRCLHMQPGSGYVEAKKLLENNFKFKITNAYMEKALNCKHMDSISEDVTMSCKT